MVQQHAARRLHWDLRLEIDGVLVSWAVPKGPSADPEQRRLAVRTEDHPLEYADFEGVIPEGNYGAGAVIVWDRGVYRCAEAGGGPAAGLEAGKLDLLLEGHKLRGRFALVRTGRAGARGGEDGRQWLLFRKGPRPEPLVEWTEAEPASVLSGLRVEELRDGVTRDAEVRRALGRPPPPPLAEPASALRPMLATARDAPFSGEGWLFELKYDGVRVLAEKDADRVRLFARSGAERTTTWPEIARAIRHLPVARCVLDGEIVALDERGRSSFERLQRRFTRSDPAAVARLRSEVPVVCYVFDALSADGRDLRAWPLAQRKALLALFAPRLGVVRFADHVEGDGEALFAAARQHGLEGVVAKRADSTYASGRRSTHWLKLKVPRRRRLAIAGYVAGRGSRSELGSLVLAGRRDGAWCYAGNVGSGLDERTLGALREAVDAARVAAPVFDEPPRFARPVVWCRPERVCEVSYTEVTGAGLLRHPVFCGLCDDADPESCTAPLPRGAEPEAAAPVPAPPGGAPGDAAPLQLTRLDKIFWPVEGYTKGDLLAYYEAAWPHIAPYLEDRPVVLTRYPDGIEGKHFYQKNAPEFTPEWARRETIDGTDYFVCNDLRTLLYVVNSGAIPLHVWSARLADLDRPDWLVLDLDPKQAPFERVVAVARSLHALLDDLGAAHAVKTSGQDGLHVLLPLAGRLDHGQARGLAEVLARVVVAESPGLATVARPLAARGEKVYVDYLQNGRGKLIAAPFSVRPRPAAPVSMPLTWRQVTRRLDPARWTIKTALARVEEHGDPFRRVLGAPVDVDALLGALAERLQEA